MLMLMLTPILTAARLRTPTLQVAKDQRHYVFFLRGVDGVHGDADVEDDVKRMMNWL